MNCEIIRKLENAAFGYEKMIALLDIIREAVANGAIGVRGLYENSLDYALHEITEQLVNYTNTLEEIAKELHALNKKDNS